jgi:hypothetical protein
MTTNMAPRLFSRNKCFSIFVSIQMLMPVSYFELSSRIGETRTAYRILMDYLLTREDRKWNAIIKMVVNEIACKERKRVKEAWNFLIARFSISNINSSDLVQLLPSVPSQPQFFSSIPHIITVFPRAAYSSIWRWKQQILAKYMHLSIKLFDVSFQKLQ